MITLEAYKGTNNYNISTTGKFALHRFSNSFTKPVSEMISLSNHQPFNKSESMAATLASSQVEKTIEFFIIKTEERIEMDGWKVKPADFNCSNKYRIVFYVYTEPLGATVKDDYGVSQNSLYKGGTFLHLSTLYTEYLKKHCPPGGI